MGTKESLHALIDELSDEDADELLDIALSSFGEPLPLSPEDREAIARGLEDVAAGRTYTTEEVLRYILERRAD